MEAAEAKSRSDRGVPPSPANVGGGEGGVRPALPKPLAPVGAGTWPQGREDFPARRESRAQGQAQPCR